MNSLFDISGKTALITGSGQGLGYTLATGLAKAGCRIILNDVDPLRLDAAVKQLSSEGYEVFGAAFDVSNEEQVRAGIDSLKGSVEKIDILVNNAGIQIRGMLEDFDTAKWDLMMNVNLKGVFVVSKVLVKSMIEANAGKIINICSIQSELARPSIAPYTASKGGVRNLTKGMATDWARHNIQINGIAPGYFKTAMTKSLYEDKEFDAWLCNRTPSNRWGNPEELVGALIFLSSDASSYVNGQLLYVDGGMTACV
jgi:gluconate 5-dehydrogenase